MKIAVVGLGYVGLVSTAHQAVNCQAPADWSSCIVDTRNAMATVKVAPGRVWKA